MLLQRCFADVPAASKAGVSLALTLAARAAHVAGDDAVAGFSSKGPTRGRVYTTLNKAWVDNLLKPDLVAPGNRVVAGGIAAIVSSLKLR